MRARRAGLFHSRLAPLYVSWAGAAIYLMGWRRYISHGLAPLYVSWAGAAICLMGWRRYMSHGLAPMVRLELTASPLPRARSAPEPHGLPHKRLCRPLFLRPAGRACQAVFWLSILALAVFPAESPGIPHKPQSLAPAKTPNKKPSAAAFQQPRPKPLKMEPKARASPINPKAWPPPKPQTKNPPPPPSSSPGQNH